MDNFSGLGPISLATITLLAQEEISSEISSSFWLMKEDITFSRQLEGMSRKTRSSSFKWREASLFSIAARFGGSLSMA
jgi:hypothetical protein